MSHTFPQKPCTNCGGETSLRPFFEKSKLSISLDTVCFCFYCMSKSRTTKINRK